MAHILVADDEAEVRAIIRRMLVKAGHEVAEAANGEEVVALLAGNRFDLAVIDVVMPRKGGVETLMEIHSQLRGMKVVVITGQVDIDSDAFRNLVTHFGASRVLRKPFKMEELLAEVSALLSAPP